MINYDTESMHSVGKAIQTNGHEFQNDLQQFWSFYQSDMHGTFSTLASYLTDFMNRCKDASHALAQNRVDIGVTLDQAATTAEQHESRLQQTYRGHMRMIPE